jgi:hypothetical protein
VFARRYHFIEQSIAARRPAATGAILTGNVLALLFPWDRGRDTKMKRIAGLLLLPLAGCSHLDKNLRADLQPLVGQNIKVPIAKIGYPTSNQVILGDMVYVWSMTSETTGTQPCILQIAASTAGIIKSYSWQGDRRGCELLEERLE